MARDLNTSKWMRQSRCLILVFACFLLLTGRYASGQVDEGSIAGTVQDTTGAVVPSASVTLLNLDQGITRQIKTNATGAYTFSPVRIGHYTITVTASGFAKTTQTNLTVQVAQALEVDVALKPGAATETVQVNEAPPLLQTEEASTGQVIGRQQVNDLPLNGRNFTFLAQLGAGMQTPQADTRGNAASGAFSANGERPAQNNYLLDGIDNNSNNVDFLNGTNYVILPPPDAIQEFKVQTSNYSAAARPRSGRGLECHRQIRHQLHSWRRVGVLPQRQAGCGRLVREQHHETAQGRTSSQPVRSNRRRPDHQEQGLFLRRLSRHAPRAGRLAQSPGADG